MFDLFGPPAATVRRPPRLILAADDFGRSAEVNRAVERAWRAGMLTSASLMVAGDAFAEAAAMAECMPGLAVGLHVVLADGRALLPRSKIPHLVDGHGRFPRDPLRAGLRYALLGRRGRAELREELAAQFARFAATGLPLSHVDGHCHLHAHPVVFHELLPLARRYGARGFRLPRDCFRVAADFAPRRARGGAVWAAVLALLSACFARRLRREGLASADQCYGLFHSGAMGEAYVAEVLRRLRGPDAEIYFHTTAGARLDPWGPNPGDLETLLSPAIRSVIEGRGLRLTNYLAP